jgi:hypothetical protein
MHAPDAPSETVDTSARIADDISDARARAFRIALWTVAIAAVAMFVYALHRFFFDGQFGLVLDSDAAVPGALAAEVLRTRSLFPPGWFVANEEIWLLAPHLVALPFFAAFGESAMALASANAVGVALAMLAMTWLVVRITRSLAFALVVATGAFAMFSILQIQMVYTQLAYGWFAATLAVLAALAIVLLRTPRVASTIALPIGATVAYSLVLLAFGTGSPMRAVVYWAIPFALATLAGPPDWPRRNRRDAIALTAIVLVVAGIAHALLVRGHSTMLPPAVYFASPLRWPDDLMRLVGAAANLIGPLPARSMLAGFASAAVARWLLFVVAALVIAWAAFTKTQRSPENAWFVRYVAIATIAVVGAVVVRGFASSPAALRYLIPHALLLLVACMTTAWYALAEHRILRLVATIVYVFGFAGTGALWAASFVHASTPCGAPQRICALASTLDAHGLTRGFATYWNANVTSVASGGKITVGNVRLLPLRPMRWLISEEAYAPFRPGERFFVAVAASDRASVDDAAFSADIGPPIETATAADFEIRIYSADARNTAWLAR